MASLDRQEPPALLSVEPAAVSTHQIGVTPPPMGWASWNSYFSSIDHNVIKQQGRGLNQETTYKQIAAANEAASAMTGRKLVLSFCE